MEVIAGQNVDARWCLTLVELHKLPQATLLSSLSYSSPLIPSHCPLSLLPSPCLLFFYPSFFSCLPFDATFTVDKPSQPTLFSSLSYNLPLLSSLSPPFSPYLASCTCFIHLHRVPEVRLSIHTLQPLSTASSSFSDAADPTGGQELLG